MRIGALIALDESASAHLVRVLRLAVGDTCVLFNGDGHDYSARLVSVEKRSSRVEITQCAAITNESPLRITLVQGIARGEKMDMILQKACELGVSAIAPVLTEHTEVKLDEQRSRKRMQHWQGVLIAACEQSGRARLPQLFEPQSLTDYLSLKNEHTIRLILDPYADKTLTTLSVPADSSLALVIGPEGGLSERDLTALRASGAMGIQLGPRILRTETAGLAAIAALNALYGDWR